LALAHCVAVRLGSQSCQHGIFYRFIEKGGRPISKQHMDSPRLSWPEGVIVAPVLADARGITIAVTIGATAERSLRVDPTADGRGVKHSFSSRASMVEILRIVGRRH